jgi:endonuclease/exonuclease/phosphatase family metal-dependent hydrolase
MGLDSGLRAHDDAKRGVMQFRAGFWDVCRGGLRKLPLLDRFDADILMLLAVSPTSGRRYREHWQGRYQCAVALEMTASRHKRPHGALIASRWPISDAWVIQELLLPERGLVARIEHPRGELTVVSWGTPNAAGDTRPVKQAAYRHMTAYLPTLPHPLVVGIDTNSWYDPPDPATELDPHPRWLEEHGFLHRGAAHGLVDVHRALVDADEQRSKLLADLRPHGPLATTFIRRPHRQPRSIAAGFEAGTAFGLDRMDRIFISDDITPIACEHLYHEALDVGGDHAAVVADLRLRRAAT